ncbi:hypothetical protein J31TS4_27520 [Paenibacillus sp. J31TS4]|uniref:ComEC/Rec2 family competence protein n=1 Tax=Paenibacillus sp. J31TS4 TaxID=2807195 RepID=UPI001B22C92A|nr:MBL fold metallo-hydrolase [Paenibacillus sp. J31TS4]GIP39472.1 hypothetical protein J31TS4_27520 [Paenibacillus sp. J31TS4]
MLTIKLFDVNSRETDGLGHPEKCPADSFLIHLQEAEKDYYVLLDGAKKGQGKAVILPYLIANGIAELDCVIVSHPHNDHFGGIVDLLGDPRITVKQFVYAPLEDELVKHSDDADNYTFWMELREQVKRLPDVWEVNETHIGSSLAFGKELSLSVLAAPDRGEMGGKTKVDLNNANLVLRLDYGKFSALFPGDCGEYQARQIMASTQGSRIQSVTMLKASHHGGDESATPAFIQACDAKVVLVPCNETVVEHRPSFVGNLHLLSRNGAKVLRADRARTIVVRTDGKRVECRAETEVFQETSILYL